jgi:methionyl-tRNA formyltransferase
MKETRPLYLLEGHSSVDCSASFLPRKAGRETKIVFFGTPEFSATILKSIINHRSLIIDSVITQPDKPVGRKQILVPSPVKVLAEKYKIRVEQPEKIENWISRKSHKANKLSAKGGSGSGGKIENLKPDLIIVAAYGQIISKEILDIPKFGCLGVHPSLLPKYRGPTPVQFAILRGEKETGVTIFLMDEEMDHGKIISNVKYQISKNETCESLSKKLAELGGRLLTDTIPRWIRREIKPKPQDHKKATYTRLLRRKDGFIDWKKIILATQTEVGPGGRSDLVGGRTSKAKEIERMVRAFTPWPGTWTEIKSKVKSQKLKVKRLKILKARLKNGKLVLEQVQLEGKKPISWEEFKKGYLTIVAFL